MATTSAKKQHPPQGRESQPSSPAEADTNSSTIPFHLGTYTERLGHVDGRGPGILRGELNPATGKLSLLGKALPTRNPAYLWSSGDYLYAALEIYDFEGRPDGAIDVFTTETKERTGGPFSSCGRGPAWIRGDNSKRWLLVANYIEGNIAVLPRNPDGSLGPARESITLAGNGTDPARQEAPHPHAILTSADNRHAYVADLGTDQILCFTFDPSRGQLRPSNKPSLKLPPASGPRHLLLHPNGRLIFVVLELSSRIAVLQRDPKDGSLALLQSVASVANPNELPNHPSEIVLSQDGRHLYLANRGHDSIAHFTLDSGTGQICLRSTTPCSGKIPRHIALSPDGRFLLVANQESDQLVSFRRDTESGSLTPSGHHLAVATPCFVLFQSPAHPQATTQD